MVISTEIFGISVQIDWDFPSRGPLRPLKAMWNDLKSEFWSIL